MAQRIEQEFGGLDVLFANAGLADLNPVISGTKRRLTALSIPTCAGPFFLIQALLPLLSDPASIILSASINAHVGMPNTSVYGVSKAALLSLPHAFGRTHLPWNSRQRRQPRTDSGTALRQAGTIRGRSENRLAALQSQIPAKRFGNPSEISSAVVFLASDESALTVGSELIVDRGLGL